MNADTILRTGADLVSGDRAKQHGDKNRVFPNIAVMWNAYLSTRSEPDDPITAYDVAQMMSLLKKVRANSGALNADDFVDDAAYSALAGELRAGR